MYEKLTLTHPILGDREFEAEVAQKLLDMPKNGGWTLKQLTTKDVELAGNSRKGKKSREK